MINFFLACLDAAQSEAENDEQYANQYSVSCNYRYDDQPQKRCKVIIEYVVTSDAGCSQDIWDYFLSSYSHDMNPIANGLFL